MAMHAMLDTGVAEPWNKRAQTTALALSLTALLCIVIAGTAIVSLKFGALLAALAGYIIASALSGNPRLLAIWAFFFTAPFNLSKYIGHIDLVSGEIAYRIEVSDFFFAIMLFYILREVVTGRRAGLKTPKVLLWWAAIFAMGCVTALTFPRHNLVGHELVRMLKMSLVFIVFSSELRTVTRFLHVCAAMLLGALVQSLVGLAQYVHGSPLGYPDLGETAARTTEILSQTSVQGEQVYRVSAFMLHPNIFGCFLAVVVPFALGLLLVKTSRYGRVFCLIVLAASVPALIITQSRSSWLGFVASCATVLLLSFFHRRVSRLSVFAVPVLALVCISILAPFSGSIITRLLHSKDDATIGREAFKEDAKRMIAAKPIFGFGLNTYTVAVQPYMLFSVAAFEGGFLPPVHNIYLLWLAETGIVGFTCHVMLWGTLFVQALFNLRVRNDMLYMVNACCIGGYIALLVDGNFSFEWRMTTVHRTFWVMSGMIMAISYWRLQHEAGPDADLTEVKVLEGAS